ncbi:hypothetical protein [Paenibacillus sp. YPG26]|uniref:hypothetical protein n=1 Tax=Paenibacillus sp. YPG26 TaxID=2878915 RepID=UPI00203C55CF|nr:hypothetical protein [Paenibacillus sp. YPG26]USB33225.1 hypothetical protein LDO05_18615 [Paenibacillus sp. YPG26]
MATGFLVAMSVFVQDDHLRLFDNAVYADLVGEGWDFGKNGEMREVGSASGVGSVVGAGIVGSAGRAVVQGMQRMQRMQEV